jgi:hypothetical protein
MRYFDDIDRARWGVAALSLLVAANGAGIVYRVTRRTVEIGPLTTTPAAELASVRVGDRLHFSAAAEGATGFLWSLSDVPVALGPEWSYAPGPEDAGRKQVRLVVTGENGEQRIRHWNVGVMRALPPELVEVSPPAGVLGCAVGERVEFRCSALARAAPGKDRLRFKWTLDDGVTRREEGSGAAAASVYDMTAEAPGTHRVAVRVGEGTGSTAIAEWTLEITRPAPEEPVVARPPPEPAPRTRTAAARPRVLSRPEPGAIEGALGEPLSLAVRVEPEKRPVSFDWTIDGRRVQHGSLPRLHYNPTAAGRHRVAVKVMAPGGELGSETWVVTVPPPSVPAESPSPVAPPPAAAAAAPLADQEVRRWFEEYAQAWSRKDSATLRRMGQVRNAEESANLERYFRSIGDLHVDVRLRGLRIDGARAVVEFERVDTITDPAGRRQELRLPPLTKQIERTAEGLRLIDQAGSRGGRGNEIRSARGW